MDHKSTVSQEQAATSKDTNSSTQDLSKKLDLGLLEEDDEFEEFPEDEWALNGPDGAAHEVDEADVNVWEDNWDDDTIEDDFSKQLRAEFEKHGMIKKTVA